MDDDGITAQLRAHMAEQGITQTELGKRIAPDSANPRQGINQYFAGRRLWLTGTMRSVLKALGLKILLVPDDGSKP